MKKFFLIMSLLLIPLSDSYAMTTVFPTPEKLFISKEEAKIKEREAYKEQLNALAQDRPQEQFEVQQAALKQQITELKRDRDTDPENEFLSKKLVLLGDMYQLNKDYKQLEERLIEKIKEHIKTLDEYIQDPAQAAYAQGLGLDHRVAFSFEDLRSKKYELDDKKTSLDLLQQQINNTQTEIKNREQAASAAAQAYKQKRDAYEKSVQGSSELFDSNAQHEQELANLEARMYEAKQQVDQLQLALLRLRIKNLSAKRDIEEAQLQILKQVFNRIKQSSIRISEADVSFARDELEKKRQKLNTEKIDIYEPKKESIKLSIIQGEQELDTLSKKNNISLTDDITQWNANIKPTPQARDAFLEIAAAYEQVRLERLRLEEIDAQLDLADLKLIIERLDTEIKLSFYKMYAGKFSSEEKIIQEVKQYELKLSDIQANIAQLETKHATVENQLSLAKKIIETVTRLRQTITDEKSSVYSQQMQLYKHSLDMLGVSEERVKQEVKTLNTLRNLYNDSVDQLKRMQQYIRFTVDELKASSGSIIWDRPEDAISWQGVKNIIPNLQTFAHDVRSYIRYFDYASLVYKIKNLFTADYALLYLLLYSFLWLCILIFIRLWLPRIIIRLQLLDRQRNAGVLFAQTFLSFIQHYYWVLAVWLSILVLLSFYVIPDPYPYIIFYLLSIPFLIYLVHRLIGYFIQVNNKNEYIFGSKEQQSRVVLCFKTLLYATIIIFFLREAFILGNYAKSELPNILKALNIIILQISIIFLITKELVLSAIPRTSDMWLTIRQYVDQYYYLILMVLIAIIVMANPYVGFGRLVLFMLSRFMYTFLLIGFLFWLHTLVKRWSSTLFFQTDQESTKERFPSAKTWYGVAIIGILLSFIFIGAIIIAKIWQWPESLKNIKEMQDVLEWLKTPRLLVHTESPISVYTVLQFLSFLLAGVIVAAAVRRFVLNRIFDVLLVDSGIQNTVVSLTRYLIMLIAFMLGMNAIGLGTQINVMLGALLVGSAFIIKDPAADLFAYFIILVQRPIKIGDYIRLNSDVMGVVRKITARSVVLRRRNSTTIIVPNSYVVNHPIINWNYVRGFIAFEDIKIVIAYKEDPLHVKDVLERVLDTSPYILKNPKPIVRLEEFGLHGYEYIMRGYISSNYTLDQWEIASAIRLATMKSLREHAIDIAVPIRMVVNYQGSLTDFTPKVDPVDGIKYE